MGVSYVYNFSVYGHMELHADFNHAPVCRKIGCRHGRFMQCYLIFIALSQGSGRILFAYQTTIVD